MINFCPNCLQHLDLDKTGSWVICPKCGYRNKIVRRHIE